MAQNTQFSIHKHTLANGLTVLVRPVNHIPRVEAHIWYNVGSKHEKTNQRGLAHLLEHMLFKGTSKLSELDINTITQKITADANAFTSQDYTCYTFRAPADAWHIALEIFADCMRNATFDEFKLESELKAVIEELRMYRDDFQGLLVEHMFASMFPEHPYGTPIIGYKQDLCSITRSGLIDFYNSYYQPNNATLVIVGDVEVQNVIEVAEKYFGHIPAAPLPAETLRTFDNDIVSRSTTLQRPTQSPWLAFMYKIPGMSEEKNHLIDVASVIIASSKSSRLYIRLVEEEGLAVDVECTAYDFFERSALLIGVWPTDGADKDKICSIIHEELSKLRESAIEPWELAIAKSKTELDFTSLLESLEKQAFVIGSSFLATKNLSFVSNYTQAVEQLSASQLQEFFAHTFQPYLEHHGKLLPLEERAQIDHARYLENSLLLEQKIVKQTDRTQPLEELKYAHTINYLPTVSFSYPKPQTHLFDNGLELIHYHNPLVPHVVIVLGFKASYLYESTDQAGFFALLLRTITDATKKYKSGELSRLLESEGIVLTAGADTIALKCLSSKVPLALEILREIVSHASVRKESFEIMRAQTFNELQEYWESPSDFIDQVCKELVYDIHPYAKPASGSKESIQAATAKKIEAFAARHLSLNQAHLVIVGDITFEDTVHFCKKYMDGWGEKVIADLTYPEMPHFEKEPLHITLNREQTVLAFTGPSIARSHQDYNKLALLDLIVTGGSSGAASSRLFQLREISGLFYTIGGSLVYGSREEPGMKLIKTIVTPDKVASAVKLIQKTLHDIAKHGITQEELDSAKKLYLSSSVELFETNVHIAQTFLFLKKMNLSFNLFDKQGEILSILNLDQVNRIAEIYCKPETLRIVKIGR